MKHNHADDVSARLDTLARMGVQGLSEAELIAEVGRLQKAIRRLDREIHTLPRPQQSTYTARHLKQAFLRWRLYACLEQLALDPLRVVDHPALTPQGK